MESARIDKNGTNNKKGETDVKEFKAAINTRIKDRPWKKLVEQSSVRCTSAIQGDKVLVLDNEGKVCIGDLSVLTK